MAREAPLAAFASSDRALIAAAASSASLLFLGDSCCSADLGERSGERSRSATPNIGEQTMFVDNQYALSMQSTCMVAGNQYAQ